MPTINPSGGGGGAAGPFAYFAVNGATYANGDHPAWTPINSVAYPNNLANAALLFNLANPLLPVAVTSGVYAISVEAICNAAHAGKVYGIFVYFDAAGPDDGPGTYGIPLDSGNATASATGIRALTAGQQIEAQVSHNIGAGAAFDFWALVQRIS